MAQWKRLNHIIIPFVYRPWSPLNYHLTCCWWCFLFQSTIECLCKVPHVRPPLLEICPHFFSGMCQALVANGSIHGMICFWSPSSVPLPWLRCGHHAQAGTSPPRQLRIGIMGFKGSSQLGLGPQLSVINAWNLGDTTHVTWVDVEQWLMSFVCNVEDAWRRRRMILC